MKLLIEILLYLMNFRRYIELNNNLETLKLNKFIELLPSILNDVNTQNISLVDVSLRFNK